MVLENVKEMWTEKPKGNKGKGVNKDRFVSKMYACPVCGGSTSLTCAGSSGATLSSWSCSAEFVEYHTTCLSRLDVGLFRPSWNKEATEHDARHHSRDCRICHRETCESTTWSGVVIVSYLPLDLQRRSV